MRTSAAEVTARALDVRVTADELIVDLADGRSISVPLAWFPRLLHATPAQRKRWRFIGDGEGIHWPAIDEDLSVAGLLRGTPAPPQVFDRSDRSDYSLQRARADSGSSKSKRSRRARR